MRTYLQNTVTIGIFILLVLLLLNFSILFGLKSDFGNKLTEIKEQSRPARLELTVIKTNCNECFDISKVIATLNDSDINITKELILASTSQEAKNIIDEYGIEKLPTIVLKGEIDKASLQNFEKISDALIFDNVVPLYIDAKTGEIVGRVSAIEIADKNCKVCANFSALTKGLQQDGVVFSEVKEIDYSGAGNLITKYGIRKIPALLLSTDIDAYVDIIQILRQMGFQLRVDYYILESQAPYAEAETGRIRGLVNLTMITDNSCKECYNVTIHKGIVIGFGVAIVEEKTVDINSSSGLELLKKYNITKVPTIILSGDVSVYNSLNNVWTDVGTVDDGVYVFRKPDVMGVYKDLATNEIIE